MSLLLLFRHKRRVIPVIIAPRVTENIKRVNHVAEPIRVKRPQWNASFARRMK